MNQTSVMFIHTISKIMNRIVRPWRWYIRLAVLWALLGQISPPTHRVLPQAPQTVDAVNQQVCVHTTLINEPDEWKIQRSLQMIREMGAGTIVEFFPWAYIEPHEGQYNWSQTNRIVEHAQNQGVKIIARMGLVPFWARPENTTLNYIEPDAFADFAEFVALFAERYAGIIDHLIIWNEPNLAFEWGFQPVQPELYTQMLQAVYDPVKAANPNAIIMAAGLAPTLEPEGSPNGLDDLLFLEGMYAAGAADYFDAMAVHTYGFERTPQDAPARNVLNFRRTELIHDIMEQNGDGDKPIYITETGWNDNPRWIHGVRPSQRIAYTLDAFEIAAQDWPWSEELCLWLFRQPFDSGTHRDNFTLVTAEFQQKPIYYAVQAYARGWEQDTALWLPPPDA